MPPVCLIALIPVINTMLIAVCKRKKAPPSRIESSRKDSSKSSSRPFPNVTENPQPPKDETGMLSKTSPATPTAQTAPGQAPTPGRAPAPSGAPAPSAPAIATDFDQARTAISPAPNVKSKSQKRNPKKDTHKSKSQKRISKKEPCGSREKETVSRQDVDSDTEMTDKLSQSQLLRPLQSNKDNDNGAYEVCGNTTTEDQKPLEK